MNRNSSIIIIIVIIIISFLLFYTLPLTKHVKKFFVTVDYAIIIIIIITIIIDSVFHIFKTYISFLVIASRHRNKW
jgi:phosphatidylserine synthase